MSLLLNTGAMHYRENANEEWKPLIIKADVDIESLADPYSPLSTYSVGEYCTHDGKVYRCISTISTAEAWNSSHWQETTIGQELESINYVRPNLLDNWYFVYGKAINNDYSSNGTFPVNQRGQAVYYNAVYTADRWMLVSPDTTAQIAPDGLHIYDTNSSHVGWSVLQQTIENVNNLIGKTVTLSALVWSSSPSDFSISLRYSSGGSPTWAEKTVDEDLVSLTTTIPNGITDLRVVFKKVTSSTDASLSIKAVKLELGSGQTLAHQENGVWVLNEIPNFADELARCKRYYNKFPVETYLSGIYRPAEGVIRLTINESVNQNVSLGMSEFFVLTEAGGIQGSYVPTSIARTYWSPTAFTVDITSSFTSAALTPVTLAIVNGTINADL